MSPLGWLRRRARRGEEAARPLTVAYVDGGAWFSWHEPALRLALAPHPLTFACDPPRADLVVGSVFGKDHKRYPKRTPRVLFVGEATADAKTLARYDVVVHTARDVPGAVYVPQYVGSFGERRRHAPRDLVKTPEGVRAALARKSRFCAFLYHRPSPEREALFDLLSRHRPVDALGRVKRSDGGGRDDRGAYGPHATYNDLAVEAYLPYKFVIAGEGTRRAGYVTEKLVNAMLAGAVPVYWGAPDVGEHFEPSSFLDAARLGPEALLAEVARLDRDDAAYAEMLGRPWLAGNVLPARFRPDPDLVARVADLWRAKGR